MIALACDHGGFELMSELKLRFDECGIEYNDFGTYSAESCDYPVFAALASQAIVSGQCEKGIFICGTGVGMSIAANKVPGIRAALCSDCFTAEMTRLHNDANVLTLGARVIGPGLAWKIVETFLSVDFGRGDRHVRRVGMLKELDIPRC